MRRSSFPGLVCVLFALITAQIASANTLMRALKNTGLEQEDIDMMTEAGKSLYLKGSPSPGSTTTWSNPTSGASGIVKIVEVTDNCVRLAHSFKTDKRPQSQQYVSRRCVSEDGGWGLTP